MTVEPTIPFPASPYCRVRARVASIWADGPDDGTHPDWRPATGEKVTLTPSIGSQLLTYDATGPEPIIVTVERVECVVDESGWLTKNDGRPVYIAPTDDPLLSAVGWTWTASIKGKTVPFAAPAGGVVDLAVFIAAPATDNTKVWVERIPELITAGSDAVDAAAVAVAARDTATGAASTATGAATTATEQAGLATTARTGAEAALAATLAASTIVGTGRPDIPATLTTPGTAALVAAATSGTVFRSTDGPQGAWEWQKRGSTWVVTQGDTMYRSINDLFTGVTSTNINIALRRSTSGGARIDMNSLTMEEPVPRLTVLATLPVGFRPSRVTRWMTAEMGSVYLTAAGHLTADAAITAGIRRASLNWLPDDPWPATLPGTPV